MKVLYGLMALVSISLHCHASVDIILRKMERHSKMEKSLKQIETLLADSSTTKEKIESNVYYDPTYLATKCIKPEWIKPLTHLGFDIRKSLIEYAHKKVLQRIQWFKKDGPCWEEFVIARRNVLKELLRCTSLTVLQSIPDIGAGMRQVGLRLEFNPKNIIDTWDEEGG